MITVEQEQHAEKCKVLQPQIKESRVNGCDCDGYHTFDELYEHRTALFAALCNRARSLSWKSYFHEDGTMFPGMFIAGTETPEGPVTYHIDDKWWNTFKCIEVDVAPKWDGHTSDDVISRLKSIK